LQASATQNGLSRTVLFNIIATRYRWLLKIKFKVSKIRNSGPEPY
jgi:hypothetical protein